MRSRLALLRRHALYCMIDHAVVEGEERSLIKVIAGFKVSPRVSASVGVTIRVCITSQGAAKGLESRFF